MKVAVCVSCKNENLYLREYVEYYKKYGATNVIIYDDNNYEDIRNVIGDYIDSGFVICIKSLGIHVNNFNDCLNRFKNDYDWICIFDCDEYLKIDSPTISEELSNYDCDLIYVNWMTMSDNNNLYYNEKPLQECFIENSKKTLYDGDFNKLASFSIENCILKPIINTKYIYNLKFDIKLAHVPILIDNTIPCTCLFYNDKNYLQWYFNTIEVDPNNNNKYLIHYETKTLHEWIQKASIGKLSNFSIFDLSPLSDLLYVRRLNFFFKINEEDSLKRNLALKLRKVYRPDKYFLQD